MFFNLVFGSTSNPSPSLLTVLPAKLLDTFAALASAQIEGSLCGSALIILINFCATLTFSSKGFVAPF
jgi:hypothetical protein